MDHPHVVLRRAHILRRDVASAQAAHGASKGLEELRTICDLGGPHDPRLPAPEGQVREGILVAHALGELHGIGNRFVVARVLPQATAAECRTARGAMDGDAGAKPRLRILDRGDVLVVLATGQHGGACGSPTVPRYTSKSASNLAAQMKSFSVRPPMACVIYFTRQLLYRTMRSGWCPSRCDTHAAAFTNAIVSW